MLAEIADFEHKTGRRTAADVQNSETFTGYTVALVTAVTKLTHYMKEVGYMFHSFGVNGLDSMTVIVTAYFPQYGKCTEFSVVGKMFYSEQ